MQTPHTRRVSARLSKRLQVRHARIPATRGTQPSERRWRSATKTLAPLGRTAAGGGAPGRVSMTRDCRPCGIKIARELNATPMMSSVWVVGAGLDFVHDITHDVCPGHFVDSADRHVPAQRQARRDKVSDLAVHGCTCSELLVGLGVHASHAFGGDEHKIAHVAVGRLQQRSQQQR